MRRYGFALSVMLLAAAPAVAATEPTAPVRISGDGLEQTIHCTGNAVTITGNGSRFTIEGRCSTVLVQGNRNWIEVQDADWIRTAGALNSVLYLNPGTRVADSGKGNSVAPKWQQ